MPSASACCNGERWQQPSTWPAREASREQQQHEQDREHDREVDQRGGFSTIAVSAARKLIFFSRLLFPRNTVTERCRISVNEVQVKMPAQREDAVADGVVDAGDAALHELPEDDGVMKTSVSGCSTAQTLPSTEPMSARNSRLAMPRTKSGSARGCSMVPSALPLHRGRAISPAPRANELRAAHRHRAGSRRERSRRATRSWPTRPDTPSFPRPGEEPTSGRTTAQQGRRSHGTCRKHWNRYRPCIRDPE